MEKERGTIFKILGIVFSIIALTGVTYAFFNYQKAGERNVIRVGKVSFSSSQTSTITLNNAFPVSRATALAAGSNDSDVGQVVITIAGDTLYSEGIEYLVSLENVKLETATNKKIPVGIIVTPEVTGELGTANANYFNNGVRGGSTSYYKVLADSLATDEEYLLVGYIRSGASEINGTLTVKAFIDIDNIAVSDTYDGTGSYSNGTKSSWVHGRTVLTTSEWNSLQGNNALSFKVRVEANEGIWVPDPTAVNEMKNFYSLSDISSIKSTITEINFIRMGEELINTHSGLIDLTASGGQGVVKAWVNNDKLYIASPGTTYLPVDCTSLFDGFTNAAKINFYNVDTSNVTQMNYLFQNCSSLTKLDLSNFDTSSVVSMNSMFKGCSSLAAIDLHSFDTSSVEEMYSMFDGCSSLVDINLNYLDTSSIVGMSGMFYNCTNLERVNLSGLGSDDLEYAILFNNNDSSLEEVIMKNFNFGEITSTGGIFAGANLTEVDLHGAIMENVTDMHEMFSSFTSLEKVDFSNITAGSVTDMSGMFYNCTSLVTLDMSSFDTSTVEDMSSMFMNCTSLVTLNLRDFDTSSVTNMSRMFAMGTYNISWTPSNNALATIIISSDWSTTSVDNHSDMFYNCTHLVGGAGTVFDSTDSIDKTYAHADASGNKGYLTLVM